VSRLLRCPTSALLTQHDYHTVYAEDGKEYHADTEAAIDVGDEDAIPAEIRALIQEGDETITELAFAYDTATDVARELGRIPRREYNVKPTEIPGTPDLIIRGNGRIVVVDHKGHEEVDSADRNAQAATYALMVARAWGYEECDVSIVYRATYRRPSHATLNAIDLAMHADRLVRLHADIEKARETPQLFLNDGVHCKYCPAFLGGCPRMEALQRRVATGELARRTEDLIPFHDDDEAADAFDLYERLKLLTQRVGAALHARALEREIVLHDGRVFGPRKKEGNRVLNGDTAYAMLRDQYGQDVADKAVSRKATQKGIESALKSAGVKTPGKAKDEIVDRLDKAGAVKRDIKTVVEVHEPSQRQLKEIA
jgi:hypothetical protein